MSGDLNDYLFAFIIVLAVNIMKSHNGGYVLSLLFFETGNPPF